MAKRITCSSGCGGFANLKNNEVPKCELSSGCGGFSSTGNRDVPYAGSASDYEDDEDSMMEDEDCLNTAIL